MNNNHFCTIIDKSYLLKVLALYNSLSNHMYTFHLWICCIDDITFNLLTQIGLKDTTLIPVHDIEDEKVKAVKPNRKLNEYCWSLKPVYILYLFENHHKINSIIYLDGDLFFFSNPKELDRQWGTKSMFVCSQRAANHTVKRTGMYQAGLIGFKRDQNAMACLKWWRDRCLECCSEQFDDDRWADQKYLDQWPRLFKSVKVIDHLGINAAFWNIRFQNVHGENHKIYVRNDKLIVFHFSGFEMFTPTEFELCRHRKLKKNHIKLIYFPYIKAIRDVMQEVKKVNKNFTYGFSKKEEKDIIYNYSRYDLSLKKIILKK